MLVLMSGRCACGGWKVVFLLPFGGIRTSACVGDTLLPAFRAASTVGAHLVRDSLSRRSSMVVVPAQAGRSAQNARRVSEASHPVSSVFGCCSDTARWLACGGLPSSCRRPGHFSLGGQREVTKRKATPMPRPCGVAAVRRGGSTGHPALTIHWPASLPATLRAIPPPACSRHRGSKVKGQSEERSLLYLVGAHPVRDRRGR